MHRNGNAIQCDFATGIVTVAPGIYHISGLSIVTYNTGGEPPKWPRCARPPPPAIAGCGCWARQTSTLTIKNEDPSVKCIGSGATANMGPSVFETYLTTTAPETKMLLEHQAGSNPEQVYLRVYVQNSKWHVHGQDQHPPSFSASMNDLLRFSSAVRRDPQIEAWFSGFADPHRLMTRTWFERMRGCGADVRELLHDGCPVACVGDAPFGYVNAFKAHANVGFFYGAMLADPAGLLEGAGKRMRHVKLRPGKELDVERFERLDRCRLSRHPATPRTAEYHHEESDGNHEEDEERLEGSKRRRLSLSADRCENQGAG